MTDSQILVVGDVHACFHTFRELIQKYWNPETEILVQVGDLIDRGNFSPETVAMARLLENRYPERTAFLKGNHEYEAIRYYESHLNTNWMRQGGDRTINQYKRGNYSFGADVHWFRERPLYWENNHVMISHAGISDTDEPLRENNPHGVLWNRLPLRHIGKVQVIGHTPQARISFREAENAWNVDTGAYRGQALSALRLNAQGEVLEQISVSTNPEDIKNKA